MFRRLRGQPHNLTYLDRVERAFRAQFDLPSDALVLVTEENGTLPGHPPLMVTVLFWKKDVRHRLRIFKPAAEIDMGDLPAAWLLPALVDDGDADCC